MSVFYSVCKKCGGIFHDSDIWKNNCKCLKCGAEDWEDG
mgnify:CR=1 FL=1